MPEFDDSWDFGFSAIDADELKLKEQIEIDKETVVVSKVNEINAEQFDTINRKLSSIIDLLDNKEDFTDDNNIDRIEEKLDKLVQMQTQELTATLQSQNDGIKAIIDEVEERKEELDKKYYDNISKLEKLIIPLLKKLMENPEKEYIYWPNRTKPIQAQIDKILSITKQNE